MAMVLYKLFVFFELTRTRQVSKMSDLEQAHTSNNETTSDTEHQEMMPHVETPGSTPTTHSQEPIPDTSSPSAKTQSKDPDQNTENEELKCMKKSNELQEAGNWIQGFASIISICMLLVTLLTLKEMETERNNAYRPEIVIAPNTFDGGYFDKNNKVVNDDYLYFYYGDIFHFEHDFFNPNDLEQPDDYLYLEKPYLTLKNIGQGTAKDVQVIFSTDWIEDVVTELNSFEGKDEYKIINMAQGIGILHSYGNPNEGIVLPLSDGSDLTKSITYISSDDGSVNVTLPESWLKILAELYGKTVQQSTLEPLITDSTSSRTTKDKAILRTEIELPDPVIIIKYSDMQGISYPQNETVPWTGYYDYENITAETDKGVEVITEKESAILHMGFFEDYIR